MFIEKEELLELIERKYGDLNDDGGCYVYHNYNGEEYQWLSVKEIVDLIDYCEEYDDIDD